MAVLGFVGNFAAVQSLVTPGDAARTAADIAASQVLFRTGVTALLLVAMLDLVVAAALFAVFESVNRTVAAAAAWFRVAYAAVLTVALGDLVLALRHLDEPARVLAAAEAFSAVWSIGLAVFAVHLVVVGWLAVRADFIPSVFGVLLGLAGAGYLVDSLGAILVDGYGLQVAMFTFFGELALIGWLLARGVRTVVPARTAVPGRVHSLSG